MNLSRRFAHGTFALLPQEGDARGAMTVRLSHPADKE
jgi:hypothetical protein